MKLFNSLRNLILSRLWVQVWLILALLATAAIALLGALLVRTSEEGVRTTLLRDHREIALRAAKEIDLFLQSPRQLLETTANLVGISHTDVWKQETLLVELGLDFPIFSRISSVSLEGVEQASSQPGEAKVDFRQNEVARRAASGEFATSKVALAKEGIPSMEMAVPYRHLGKVASVLHATVNLRGMWDIVDKIQIGQSGFAWIVAEDGTVVAHPDKKRVLRNINVKKLPHVKKALNGERGSSVFTSEETGKVLVAYAPIGNIGWGLVTRQNWDEAFSFARRMTAQSRLFILGGLLGAVAISVGLALAISRPVKKLATAANRVGEGDLEIQIDSKRRDEIGTLIRNFAQMIAQLKKAKEMERVTAMGMAAARIAHELRNPLVAIKTYTQVFSRRKKEEGFLNRFEGAVPQEIERLERLLGELTDFSKIEQLNFTQVPLKQIVKETLILQKEKLKQQKIELREEMPAQDKMRVRADPERLKQVLINLISNAAQAMESGGRLTVALSERDGHACVTMADTGKGISPDLLGTLFEPFHTTRRGGMGLGLSICRKIIEQHQGKIEVESRPNAGTTFTIWLPLSPLS